MSETLLHDGVYAKLCASAGKVAEIVPSAARSTAAVNSVIATVSGLSIWKQAQILMLLTNAGNAGGDTLDIYVDTSPDGSSWLNVIHFTQILGNGADTISESAVLDPGGNPAATIVDLTSDAASGVVRPSIFCDYIRVRHTLVNGGGTHTFTYSVLAQFKG